LIFHRCIAFSSSVHHHYIYNNCVLIIRNNTIRTPIIISFRIFFFFFLYFIHVCGFVTHILIYFTNIPKFLDLFIFHFYAGNIFKLNFFFKLMLFSAFRSVIFLIFESYDIIVIASDATYIILYIICPLAISSNPFKPSVYPRLSAYHKTLSLSTLQRRP